jgi:selenium-binding protein 1
VPRIRQRTAISTAGRRWWRQRDGKRVYFTNSLYGAVDPQFYPEGIDGWMVKLDVDPGGGVAFDPKFFVEWPKSHRPHQIRLEGGDSS